MFEELLSLLSCKDDTLPGFSFLTTSKKTRRMIINLPQPGTKNTYKCCVAPIVVKLPLALIPLSEYNDMEEGEEKEARIIELADERAEWIFGSLASSHPDVCSQKAQKEFKLMEPTPLGVADTVATFLHVGINGKQGERLRSRLSVLLPFPIFASRRACLEF